MSASHATSRPLPSRIVPTSQSFSDGQKPCFEWQSNYNFNSNSGTSKLTIFTPAGDPKMI